MRLRELIDTLRPRLLERTEAPISPYKGFVRLGVDTYVLDNSGTKKEAVGRTYQGVDGYCPIAAYLGNEVWLLGLGLRAGTWHSAFETQYFYERIFPRARHQVSPTQPVRLTEDSGFDHGSSASPAIYGGVSETKHLPGA